MSTPPSVAIAGRVSPDIAESLRAAAQTDGRSVSEIVGAIVTERVDPLHWLPRATASDEPRRVP